MRFEPGELHTETFTNSKGWTIVRVTHVPSGTTAERERSELLMSSVDAQSECVAELRQRLQRSGGTRSAPPARSDDAPVSRSEFDALLQRVAALERRLDEPSG